MDLSAIARRHAIDHSDSATPNFISVDKEGNITAEFSGHLIATGLDLPEYDFKVVHPEGDSQIRWKSPSTKRVQERIMGYGEDPTNAVISAIANVNRDRLRGEAYLESSNGEGLLAGIQAIAANGAGGQKVVAIAGLLQALTVIDDAGRSNFLKVVGFLASRSIAMGETTAVFEAGSAISLETTVSHGLEVVPKICIPVLLTTTGGSLFTPRVTAKELVTFKFLYNRNEPVAVKTTVTIMWLAIG